nr:transglutaminase-like domain-containing protein [Oscillospiraceae bacterium]
VLNPSAPGTSVQQNSSAVIDYSNASDGYIMVKWTGGSTSSKLKVLIKGPNCSENYQYNLRSDGSYDTFPMSDGNGKYSIQVCKQVSGTKYSQVLSTSITVQLTDEFAPFIRPNQYVNYSDDSAAVAKAAELIKEAGVTDNLSKVGVIYDWVINALTYDTAKAKSVQSGYLPDIDKVMAEGKGICFDYAALMAAMLRSQGVPIKLVVGYTGSQYHAWINVWSEDGGWVDGVIYFDGQIWKLMDPTYASSGKQSASIMKYIGDASNYKARFLY